MARDNPMGPCNGLVGWFPRAHPLARFLRFLHPPFSAKSACNLTGSNCSPSSSSLFAINRKFPIAAPLPSCCICLPVGWLARSLRDRPTYCVRVCVCVCARVCVFTLLDRSLKFEPMRVLFLPVTVLYWTLERAFTRNGACACAYVYMCAPRVYLLRNAPRVALFIHRRHRRRRRSCGAALTIYILFSSVLEKRPYLTEKPSSFFQG